MDSKVGLIIQLSGIFLIAILSFSLTVSLKSATLKYWKYAWLFLSFSLFSLYIAFEFEAIAKPFFAFYYLGEYVFAYLLIRGCQNYASDKKIVRRDCLWLVPAAAALLMTFLIADFNAAYCLHTVLLAASFAAAFYSLKPAHVLREENFGWRVMRVSLLLLAINFFHYTVIFTLQNTSYPAFLSLYLAFNSIIDLVLEILLGFGMVIVLLERVRQDIEETNRKLKDAHDKLEQLAHIDPLTAAFTRHAFYSFMQRQNKENNAVSGCVGVFDIDNLKPINDRFGHAVGDIAISSVAHAIRSLVRADDMIFRWGGDEFFVVMLGLETERAIDRMCKLNAILEDIKLRGLAEKISIKVSFGFADFSDTANLEKSIERADAEMYRAKQQSKCEQEKEEFAFISPPLQQENLVALH